MPGDIHGEYLPRLLYRDESWRARVADAIHLVSGVERALRCGRFNPDRVRAAVAAAFGTLGPPCFFTSLTTAVGFASLAGVPAGPIGASRSGSSGISSISVPCG